MELYGIRGNGTHLVEMTEAEWRALADLRVAVEGKYPDWSVGPSLARFIDRDLSLPIQAIKRWVELRFLANEFIEKVEALRAALDGETGLE